MTVKSFVLFEHEYEALLGSLQRDLSTLSSKVFADPVNASLHVAQARMVSRLLEIFAPYALAKSPPQAIEVEVLLSEACALPLL